MEDDRNTLHAGLPESRWRQLASTLTSLESRLAQIDAVLDEEKQGTLNHTSLDLSPERREQMRSLRHEVQGVLNDMAMHFELPARERNGMRIMEAMVSLSWAALLELQAKESTLPAQADLNGYLDRLVDMIEHMLGLLRSGA